MTSSVRAACAMLGLFVASAHAARIDPAHAQNLTLYHVNERNYSVSPRNMNTADLNGDMFFDLRSKPLAMECAPGQPSTHDCTMLPE